MKILRCVGCDLQVSVTGPADRVWCVNCLLTAREEVPHNLAAPLSARTERHQTRLI